MVPNGEKPESHKKYFQNYLSQGLLQTQVRSLHVDATIQQVRCCLERKSMIYCHIHHPQYSDILTSSKQDELPSSMVSSQSSVEMRMAQKVSISNCPYTYFSSIQHRLILAWAAFQGVSNPLDIYSRLHKQYQCKKH